ncbi:hypothetical protein [Synechococcus sp. Cruz CV-v-12]|uniref:hypothetical protein n=1 Tax=Synechococcus sp. Cruz CV-v-12 TaxID=2823728 RepID=UPI0020CF3EBA|nr:hypothetical protein [Synechococcus sp. Cruz CV-v-12]MCP9874704.1 hypothetical protein [Synechococcus sp. Cruz CV-v-12]
MSLPRETFNTTFADLDFSMDLPVGFFHPDLPHEPADFNDPTVSTPLMITASAVALAVVTVAARPAYQTGSVIEWLTFLCNHYGITLTEIAPGRVGGLTQWHPAILAKGTQVQDGVTLVMQFVAMEDGGRFLTVHAMCPVELEPSYLPTLTTCIHSIELRHPQGPTVPLVPDADRPTIQTIAHDPALPPPRNHAEVYHRKMAAARTAAVQQARPRVESGEFDAAEQIVRQADDSIMGYVALGQLYTDVLRAHVVSGRARSEFALRLFKRALKWKQSAYPEVHTEVEAEDMAAGQIRDRAELVEVLGYDPGEHP